MTELADDAALPAWAGLLVASTEVVRRLEADLLRQHSLPLSWFDVLNRLDQAGGRLRLRELEERCIFTTSGMTRLCDRMQAAGLVTREPSPEDRRGIYIAISNQGADTLSAVWPDHRASIQQHFARFFDASELEELRSLATKLITGLDGSPPTISPRAAP